MANFEVIYKIEVEAETALEAATVAETIMLSSVERPQFFVAKETKNPTIYSKRGCYASI